MNEWPIMGNDWPKDLTKEKEMSKIIAAKTRILFTRKEAEKTTASGIVLSNPNQETNPLGTVYSIGSDVAIEGLEVGDQISVNWQSVGMMMHNEEKIYIVDQNNVNAFIKATSNGQD